MEIKLSKYYLQAGLIVSLFCLSLFSSCNSDKVVASVGDISLTENEAFVLMQFQDYDIDNKKEFKAFLKNWCAQESFKQELKKEHPEQWELVRLRGESFTADLAKFYIEEIELQKQLDTIVNSIEIQQFYDSHKEEFIIQDYLVKAIYLKIPKSVDFREEKIQYKYLLKKDKDSVDIDSYAKLYAENFYNDSNWVYFKELSKDIPLEKYNVDNIVLNRVKTYFSDKEHTYFLNIIDYKLKDDAPPLSYLEERIKEIIIFNRLQMLREQNEKKLTKKLKLKYETSINI